MYKGRLSLYEEIEKKQESKLLVYITGDRGGLETQIGSDVLSRFLEHLDVIGDVPKISLYLYTRGGNTLSAWSIVNLIRQFCDDFEVLVPSIAHSAGTLICLGADDIIMTKQATLGPIDPSANTPLNPPIPGAPITSRFPVSVEAINGYIELAKGMGVQSSSDLTTIMSILSSHVHPLVLGNVYRMRSQIRMLGEKLLSKHIDDKTKIDKILAFLCSESGSHDYTIYRQEARDNLGLNVKRPDDDLYRIMKKIYDDISGELKLTEKYNPITTLGDKTSVDYDFIRCLIESKDGGSHKFKSIGKLNKIEKVVNNQRITEIEDSRMFEGWEYGNN